MNENIYSTPERNLSEGATARISIIRKILWSIGIVFTANTYKAIDKAVPQFVETFSSFGADLPLMTRIAIHAHGAFHWISIISLLLILFLVVSIFNEKYAKVMLKISKYNLFISISVFVLFMISMYLPIFMLGSVIVL